ncbi:hypothetical protein SAMN07250955_11769 [Arboricoccus pini]|uniref:Enoyl-(Acyl carrier protein) reductase n=1 Tax=Arboricoccus pini TaxID=1963835 RepID=A0A212RZB9_9PROT|nr:hypothetical protein SAMN07250955_11769 [Arboricoccus pini]
MPREIFPESARVNCVRPGFVKTGTHARELACEGMHARHRPEAAHREYIDLTLLCRHEKATDVPDIVLFQAGDLARFLTREAVNASGGVTMD